MARNGSGVYSLPDGYEAVTGETILATQHNTPLEDLQADANAVRPVVAGGTGVASSSLPDTWTFYDSVDDTKLVRLDAGSLPTATTHAINAAWLQRKSADIASATTTDLATATGGYVDITGTTTITGLGTVAAGMEFILQFDGILTLTYNATSLIIPGAADIVTAAGDVAKFVSEGSGNWRMTNYQRAASTTTGSVAVGGAPTYPITIPFWANMVVIGLDNISPSSSGIPRIQLADAGGTETTGYSGGGAVIGGSNFVSTIGLEITAATTSAFQATIILTRRTSSSWLMHSTATFTSNGSTVVSNVSKSTSADTTGFVLMNSAGANFSASGAMVATFHP